MNLPIAACFGAAFIIGLLMIAVLVTDRKEARLDLERRSRQFMLSALFLALATAFVAVSGVGTYLLVS